MKEIYLDNAATTRPRPEVIEAVSRAMGADFGNASSLHSRGLAAARRVESAAEAIRDAVGKGQWNVIFTSGGSESDTMAVLGSAPRGRRDTVVTTSLEHPAVEQACVRATESKGRLKTISAGASGVADPDEIAAAVDERTALVSVIHVSNELGTIQPVARIAELTKSKAPLCRVHVDAVQALAQLDTLEYPAEVDMVSISAHKIHGPQGMGALLLRPNVRPKPLVCGGDQQGGLRPGTLNLPGIAGFEAAIRLLKKERAQCARRMAELTGRLVQGITQTVDGVRPLGDQALRAPGIVALSVDRAPSEVLLHSLEMRGVLAASGSACHSTRREPSVALREAGLRQDQGAVRLSLAFDTTVEMIDSAIGAFVEAVQAVRSGKAGAS